MNMSYIQEGVLVQEMTALSTGKTSIQLKPSHSSQGEVEEECILITFKFLILMQVLVDFLISLTDFELACFAC
jgi:hypothetical protein